MVEVAEVTRILPPPRVEDGLDMKIIAAFLGDTIKTVEENYLHLSPDYLRQAVDR